MRFKNKEILRYSGHKHVLVVVPVNTIQNWRNEFNKWSPRSPSDGQPVDPNVDYRSLDVYAIDESSRLFEQKVNTLRNDYFSIKC